MIATSGFLTALECTKFVFGRGSAPDPAGGAHDVPPDPLVGWGGGYPLPIGIPPPHSPPLDASVSVSSPTTTRPRAFGARSSTPSSLNFPPMLGVWIKHCLPRWLECECRFADFFFVARRIFISFFTRNMSAILSAVAFCR